MIVLGLDPGEATGYALIKITDDGGFMPAGYGTIPQLKAGIGGLLVSVYDWFDSVPSFTDLAFEEFICSQRMRTTREAGEVRGVIRLWAERSFPDYKGYYPATIHSRLACKNKKEVRALVEKLIGFKVKGADHVTDAFAVALVHGIALGALTKLDFRPADFTLTRKIGGRQTAMPGPDEEITTERAVALLNAGKATVKRSVKQTTQNGHVGQSVPGTRATEGYSPGGAEVAK